VPGTAPPQLMVAPLHSPPTQQPPLAHVESAQHGWPAAPHAATCPAEQTMPLPASASPEATQLSDAPPPVQQAPP